MEGAREGAGGRVKVSSVLIEPHPLSLVATETTFVLLFLQGTALLMMSSQRVPLLPLLMMQMRMRQALVLLLLRELQGGSSSRLCPP